MAEKRVNSKRQSIGRGRMGNGESAKNFKRAMSDFLNYIGKYKVGLLLSFVFSVAAACLALIGPHKLGEMTDLIKEAFFNRMDLPAVIKVATTLAVIYVLSFIINYAQGFLMATITQKITKNMRGDISKKINALPLKYFDSHPIGDTLSRITNDVDMVGQTMNQSFTTLIYSLALFLGAAIMMIITDWIMALSGIVSALIGFAGVVVIIKHSQKYFRLQQKSLGSINSHVEESYGGIKIIKAYNAQTEFRTEFNKRNDELYKSAWKSQFLSGLMMPLMNFIGNFAYVVVCIVGAVLVMKGRISFGVIVAFMLYIRNFTFPLVNISQALASVQGMAAACERVFEFMNEEEMNKEDALDIDVSNIKGDVKFENVRFGYDEERLIIKNFNEEIKAGQKIAIVGPTGAGKTTLVNLLMRFYDTTGGNIYIDGINIKDMSRSQVHQIFGMVLQDTWMFEGTVRENLVYNKAGVTDQKLDEICEMVGLKDLIEQLPNGYDTVLGDNASLSEGQKQFFTIARAMIADHPLLILDEATSSVDTRTEAKLQKAMDIISKGRTSFVIAHRVSTIKNADCILVLKDGDVIESGNHEELLALNGFYAELYNSQFEVA